MFYKNSNWVFPWSFILHLFGIILQYFRRLCSIKSEENSTILGEICGKSNENSSENGGVEMGCDQIEKKEILKLNCEEVSICNTSSNPIFAILGEICGKSNENSSENDGVEMGCDPIEEKEIPKLDCEKVNIYNASSNTSKYEFIGGNSVSAFIEEPKIMNFTVHNVFVVSYNESFPRQNSPRKDDYCSSKFDFSSFQVSKSISLEFGVDSCSLKNKNSDCDEFIEEKVEKQEEKTENSVLALTYEVQHENTEKEEIFDLEESKIVEKVELFDEPRISLSESDDFWASIYEYDDFLSDNEKFDCNVGELEPQKLIDMDNTNFDYDQDSPISINQKINSQIDYDIDNDVEMEIKGDESSFIELDCDEQSLENGELKDLDDETMANDLIMEQKELIRKMKKEIRQLKIIGLPTIFEELVCSKVEEDLRPLKIDEKIGHKDRMDEIQSFYKSYLDKMKKLDILSQQTVYAINLALNKSISNQLIKPFHNQNLWSNILKKHKQGTDQKYLRNLQSELELAYVSQICLSWEILKWQHYKSEELRVNDPTGFHNHNEVAGEFQKFEVLLRRFVEDEPYQEGTRVEQFVNTRHGLPAFLQVPLIKDDSKRDEEGGFSIEMLIELIESSMHSYWDFIHADKFEVCAIPCFDIHWVQIVLQDPSDSDILTEIRSDLQKKKKRLKDLLRTGNCLVKKFQKQQDQKLSHEMVVAQTELRLVSRVLSLQKVTTDQLLWCLKKLNNIDIIGKSIYLNSSFLPFPC